MKFYLVSSALVLLSSALTIISATEPPKLRGAIAVDNIKAIAYGEDYTSDTYNEFYEHHYGGPTGYNGGDYQDNPGYQHSAMGQPQEAAEFAAVSYGHRHHGHGGSGRHHHSHNYAPTPAPTSSDAAAAKAYALTQCCTVEWQLPRAILKFVDLVFAVLQVCTSLLLAPLLGMSTVHAISL